MAQTDQQLAALKTNLDNKLNEMRNVEISLVRIHLKGGDEALNRAVGDNIDKLISHFTQVRQQDPTIYKQGVVQIKLSTLLQVLQTYLISRPDSEWGFIPILLQAVKPEHQIKIFNLFLLLVGAGPLKPEEEKFYLDKGLMEVWKEAAKLGQHQQGSQAPSPSK